MPPDLNLKKSWNPKLLKNKAKRWKIEHDLLETHKQLKQRELESQKEKEKSDLLNLSHNNKDKPDSKISWIYQNGQNGSGNESLLNNTNPSDDFLLGKKRIDSLVLESKQNKNDESKNASKLDRILSSDPIATTNTDKLDKDDPMYALKLQQERRRQLMEMNQSNDKYKPSSSSSSSSRHRDDEHRSKSRHEHREKRHSQRHTSSNSGSSDSHRHSHSSRHRHSSSSKGNEESGKSSEKRDRSRDRSSIKYRER